MARGGKRNNAGRKEGSTNKLTTELREILLNTVIDYYKSNDYKSDQKEVKGQARIELMRRTSNMLLPSLKAIDEAKERGSGIKTIIVESVEPKEPVILNVNLGRTNPLGTNKEAPDNNTN